MSTFARKACSEKNFTCTAAIRHQIAVDAAEGEQGALLIQALTRALPRSDREQPKTFPYIYHRYALAEDRDLLRRVRITVYANDEAEFVRLRELFDRDDDDRSGATILRIVPGQGAGRYEWLERRAPAIREALLHGMVIALLETGTAGSETAAVIARFAQSTQVSSSALTTALLWWDLLAGNLDAARGRIARLPPEYAVTAAASAAVIHFLTGENTRAIAGFREALKQHRKNTSTRRSVLPGAAGAFHVLALLRENDARLHGEIRNLLEAAFSNGTIPWIGYFALRALFQVAGGDDESAQKVMAQLDLPGTKDPLGGALVALACLHMDSEAAGKHVAANEAAFDRIAAHLPLIGRIHAEILARVSPQQERWCAILHNMGMQEIIAFIDIIGFKPRWERAFERLAAFLEVACNCGLV